MHDLVGDWKDDNTLELKRTGDCEGDTVSEDISLKFVSRDDIRISENDYSKEKLSLSVDYILKRKS